MTQEQDKLLLGLNAVYQVPATGSNSDADLANIICETTSDQAAILADLKLYDKVKFVGRIAGIKRKYGAYHGFVVIIDDATAIEIR